MNYTEAIALARQGSEEGFKYLYEETYHKNYYIALKYMKQEEAAMDVLQDAYIKVFENLEQLQEADKFPAWFSCIVATKALDALRKRRLVLFSEMEDEDGGTPEETLREERLEYQPELSMDKEETSRLVKEMIDALSDEQRLCILMFYMEQMSVKEISSVLGVSENTVKSRLNYGRKNIKDKVLELEKNGTKLYGVAPIPLLLYLLMADAQNVEAATGMQTMMPNVINAGVNATRGMAAMSQTAGMAGAGAVSTGVVAKVAAVIGGVALVSTGIAVAVALNVGSKGDNQVTNPGNTDGYIDYESSYDDDNNIGDNTIEDGVIFTDDFFGQLEVRLEGDTIYISGDSTIHHDMASICNKYSDVANHIVIEDGIQGLETEIFMGTQGYETITIADSVTYMGASVFSDSSFTSVKLPANITAIEGLTFSGCSNITEIEIPDAVTRIDRTAFNNCTSLYYVKLPAGYEALEAETFSGCTSLTTLTLNGDGDGATYDWLRYVDSLMYIIIRDGAQSVRIYLDKQDVIMQIPATVTDIGLSGVGAIYGEKESYAHHYATMEGIDFYVGDVFGGAYLAGDYIMKTQWPQCPDVSEEMEIAASSDSAFTIRRDASLICIGRGKYEYSIDVNVSDKECEYLYVAEGVTDIGLMSFLDYTNLQYVEMADTVTNIGMSAFKKTTDLREIKLSAGLKSIGENAFYESGLEYIEIPAGVENIDECAFYRCTGLRYIKIEEGLKTIGDTAFCQTSLTKLYLPDGVETIGSGAFSNCDELVEVRIPDSVTYIADNAFTGCGTTYQENSYSESYLKIIGKAGSYAETYAEAQGIEFVAE